MKLASFSKILSSTYTDKLTITRRVKIPNPDGTTGFGYPPIPLYSDKACRISFKESDVPEMGKEDTNPFTMQVKIFGAPELDIQKGDKLVAQKIDESGNVMATYTGTANLPLKYVTHQEVLFDKVGDA